MDWGRDRTGLELPWRDGSRNHHRDNNLRAAYLHVVADAATSVLAIAALVVSDHPPSTYKRRLGGLCGLSHVTVEVETCPHPHEQAR